MLETGTVAQDRYRVVRLLGQGGMGSVYRAWDLRLKVPVALKELLPQPGLDTETLAGLRDQFEQEAGVLARLNHPNLVRVTDFFEEQGKAYLVMDFVDGRSLADIIIQEGAQSETKALDWGRQLLESLDYCHNNGVIHRDIKPQNIIVKPDGSAVLVDFGLVKLWDPNDPQTRTVMRGMGTPEYAPPEQYGVTTDHTGPPSDVYSLGATLYHLLTGQAPPTATERMALPEQFVPLRQIVPGVSNKAEYLVMKALALSVSERWQTAREMLAALVSGPLPEPGRMELPRTRVAPTPPPASRTGGYPTRQPAPITGGYGAPPIQPRMGTAAPVRRRPKGFWIGIVGAVLVCIALSCGGYVLGRPVIESLLEPTDAPTSTAAPPTSTRAVSSPTVTPLPAATPPPAVGQLEVNVRNWSPYEVCYVFISPSDSDSWGEDWLGSEETIPSNGLRSFTVPAGSYDFIARACDEAIMATAWEFASGLDIEISRQDLVPLRVTNDIDVDVCYFFISPEVNDNWGDDQLGELEVIEPGQTRIFFVFPMTFDLMTQDCDGNVVAEQYGFIVQAEGYWSLSQGAVAP